MDDIGWTLPLIASTKSIHVFICLVWHLNPSSDLPTKPQIVQNWWFQDKVGDNDNDVFLFAFASLRHWSQSFSKLLMPLKQQALHFFWSEASYSKVLDRKLIAARLLFSLPLNLCNSLPCFFFQSDAGYTWGPWLFCHHTFWWHSQCFSVMLCKS